MIDRVQTESLELQPWTDDRTLMGLQTAVHGCNSWLSVWTLSCRCPLKVEQRSIAIDCTHEEKINFEGFPKK